MKIICPNCQKVHEIEEGALQLTCDECNQVTDIDDAKRYTLQKYKEYTNLGYNNLYLSLDFPAAYENYKKALEIKPNDLTSIMGLCLTKTSMSTFEKTYFDKVIEIIDSYEVYLNVENTVLFLNFIHDILDQINFYFTEVESRCIVDKTFVNKQIFTEYAKACNDIKNLLSYLRESFEIMDQEEFKSFIEDNPNYMPRLEKREKDIEERLKNIYNVNHFGDVKIVNGDVEIIGTNKVDLDSDEVSNSNLVVKNEDAIKLKKIFWPILGTFLVLTIIMLIVFLTTKNDIFMYIFAGSGGLGLILYGVYIYLFKKTQK